MISFVSYLNPLSKEHHAVAGFKDLSCGGKVITVALTALVTIATLPIFGLGGVATFRLLTRKFTPIKLGPHLLAPVEKTVKKVDVIRKTTMQIETIKTSIVSMETETIDISIKQDEEFLAKKVVNKWKQFTKDRIAARGCRLVDSPNCEVLKSKILAVHATDILPTKNQIIAGSLFTGVVNKRTFLKPTLHFSLGSLVAEHTEGSWEKKKYAVITPLKNIVPNLINLYPYDTVVLGDLEMDDDFTLLIPEGEEFPRSHFKIAVYPKNQTLREAIDEHIQKNEGWKFDLTKGGGSVNSGAEIEHFPKHSHDGCQPTFFKKMLEEDQHLSFGPVSTTIYRGEGWRFASLDNIAGDLFFDYLYFSKMGALQQCMATGYDHNYLNFLVKWIEYNLHELEDLVSKKFSNQKIKSFERFKKELKILLYLIKFDLHQSKEGWITKPLMIQSKSTELEDWLNTKVDTLRKQENISFNNFSEEETKTVRNFLKDKKNKYLDNIEKRYLREKVSEMFSKMKEEEYQSFIKEGFPEGFNEKIIDFHRFLNRWSESGKREDKEIFLAGINNRFEDLKKYFLVYESGFLSRKIQMLERNIPMASATRKTILRDIITELKGLKQRMSGDGFQKK